MKKTVVIILFTLLLALFGIPKIPWVQTRMLNWIGEQAGVALTAEELKIGGLWNTFSVRGLMIREQASDRYPVARVRSLEIKVNPLSLLGDSWEFSSINLDVEFFHLLKDREGDYSLFFQQPAVRAHRLPAPKPMPVEKIEELGKMPAPIEAQKKISVENFRLGEVHLKIGRVQYEDYSRGNQPLRMTAEVNSEHHFEEVDDLDALAEGLTQDVMDKFKALNLSF